MTARFVNVDAARERFDASLSGIGSIGLFDVSFVRCGGFDGSSIVVIENSFVDSTSSVHFVESGSSELCLTDLVNVAEFGLIGDTDSPSPSPFLSPIPRTLQSNLSNQAVEIYVSTRDDGNMGYFVVIFNSQQLKDYSLSVELTFCGHRATDDYGTDLYLHMFGEVVIPPEPARIEGIESRSFSDKTVLTLKGRLFTGDINSHSNLSHRHHRHEMASIEESLASSDIVVVFGSQYSMFASIIVNSGLTHTISPPVSAFSIDPQVSEDGMECTLVVTGTGFIEAEHFVLVLAESSDSNADPITLEFEIVMKSSTEGESARIELGSGDSPIKTPPSLTTPSEPSLLVNAIFVDGGIATESNPCGTIASPCQTVDRALQIIRDALIVDMEILVTGSPVLSQSFEMGSGMTLVIERATKFTETIKIPTDAISSSPLVVLSGGRFKLDHLSFVIDCTSSSLCLFSTTNTEVELENVHMTGPSNGSTPTLNEEIDEQGVFSLDGSTLEVSFCKFSSNSPRSSLYREDECEGEDGSWSWEGRSVARSSDCVAGDSGCSRGHHHSRCAPTPKAKKENEQEMQDGEVPVEDEKMEVVVTDHKLNTNPNNSLVSDPNDGETKDEVIPDSVIDVEEYIEALVCVDGVKVVVAQKKDTLYNRLHSQNRREVVKRTVRQQIASGLSAIAQKASDAAILKAVSSHNILFDDSGRVCFKTNMDIVRPVDQPRQSQQTNDDGNVDDGNVERNGNAERNTKTERPKEDPASESQRWLAPEVAEKKTNVIASQASVFSLGLVLWEIETGFVPYGEQDGVNAVRQIVAGVPPDLSQVKNAEMRELIEQCLVTNPKERPQLAEIATLLDEIEDIPEKLPQQSIES
ncbi:hypothetical protein BLNAU_24977 [Blattamonas nauphoetae]|uniref:Protein kinase domain-containing protein n=1 Tax=Blattamonas nauphoetae TaxID=2049346 RepID=A0ABQ9WKX1_9EUKA|nr:hypothetical protein BLNAU_24977 [Blattamonas nauphoetae]